MKDFQTFMSNLIIDFKIVTKAHLILNGKFAPLFVSPKHRDELFSEETSVNSEQNRKPNLNQAIVAEIAKKLDLEFVSEKEIEGNVCFANSKELQDAYKTSFAPIDILNYIYAVLHAPNYREKYKEFFKIDFPRAPYPKDEKTFWKLVQLGSEIRQIHLLESETVENFITTYPVSGDDIITRKMTKTSLGFEPNVIESETEQFDNDKEIAASQTPRNDVKGKVWINDTQYFDKVPKIAWDFYIGGYQPAQKWLKDRKDRKLGYEDILHYQKIIVALFETANIMQQIDAIEIE